MIYLLGIDHQVQHNRSLPMTRFFVEYLEKRAVELNILLIAEEFFEELLSVNNVSSTTVQDIAKKLNINHRFCDLNKQDRTAIGWRSKKDDLKREKCWLDNIKDSLGKQVIFVCGSNHLETFGSLLSKNGISFKFLSKRFG